MQKEERYLYNVSNTIIGWDTRDCDKEPKDSSKVEVLKSLLPLKAVFINSYDKVENYEITSIEYDGRNGHWFHVNCLDDGSYWVTRTLNGFIEEEINLYEEDYIGDLEEELNDLKEQLEKLNNVDSFELIDEFIEE